MGVVVIIAVIVLVMVIVLKKRKRKTYFTNGAQVNRQAMPVRYIDQRITEPNKELIEKIFLCLDVIIDNMSAPLRESPAKEMELEDMGLIIIGSPRDDCPVIVFTVLSDKEREYVFSDFQRSRNILAVFNEQRKNEGYSYDAVVGNIKGGEDVVIEELSKMISNKFPYAFVMVDELNILIDRSRSTFERR